MWGDFRRWFRRPEVSPRNRIDASEDFIRHGNKLLAAGRIDAAATQYKKALEADSSNTDACVNLGFALKVLGQTDLAKKYLEQAILSKPDSDDAHYLLGLIAELHHDTKMACLHLETAIDLKPGFSIARHDLCRIYLNIDRYEDAQRIAEQGLSADPQSAELHFSLGNVHLAKKSFQQAISFYEKAISINPDYFEAHRNKGAALHELNRLTDSLASYDEAISIKPDYPEAHYGRGNALLALRRLDDALASFEQAISINPDYVKAYLNRGSTLHGLKRLNEALASYDEAISIKPDFAEAYNNRGVVLEDLKRPQEAQASYETAIRIKPDYAEAYCNMGNVHQDLGLHQAAIEDYEHALNINPNINYLAGALLHTQMKACMWHSISKNLERITSDIAIGKKSSTPFPLLALSSDLSMQRQAAEIYISDTFPQIQTFPPDKQSAKNAKIRIGYFSSDFRSHAVSILMAEVFELHDRSRFEITGFAFRRDSQDEMWQRVSSAFDHLVYVGDQSDEQIAELSRAMGIDIAVDLGGFTKGCRPGVFARRAAPIQVSYIGYLGTMGAPYIDYLLADRVIIPEGHKKYYCEKIAYLPSYQANDSKRQTSSRIFTRSELGLPPTGFIFCCFNNNYKITPKTFDSWMRILQGVADSVLLLYADNELAKGNLKKEAGDRGINPARIIFGKRIPTSDYLARYRVADLFLDTLPYNAGTTASDALWVGLPVLTQIGESFSGRVAASLLTAIDLPELITSTADEYEHLAIELATSTDKLDKIKRKLANNRLTTLLFNSRLFTRHLEAAFEAMHQRFRADLPPEHLSVPCLEDQSVKAHS